MANYRTFSRRRRRLAFTLIELLVVVSIIALLVSILLPALSKAREQAKAVVCMSHLRGMGLAFHVYAAEHDGVFTLQRAGIPYLYQDALNQWSGPGLLYREGYLDDLKSLDCPNRRPTISRWIASYSSRPYRHPQGGFYGYQGDWYSYGTLRPLRVDQVRDPYSLGMLVDLVYQYSDPYLFHNKAWNVLFVDGHVLQARETDGTLQTQMENYPPYNSAQWTLGAFRIIERYANGYPSVEY